MQVNKFERFIRRNIATALKLELYAKNKSVPTERRTKAFKIAQRIRAAHGMAV